MSSIYVIRHAQASFGSDNYDELSSLGRRQAAVLGDYLKQCGIHFDAAYCGALQRQRETAELALAGQPVPIAVTVDARFNEVRNDEHLKKLLPQVVEQRHDIRALMDSGLRSSSDYQKAIEAVFNYWISLDTDVAGVRSWADYSGDVHAALFEITSNEGSGKTIGLFTSGGTIATIVAHVLGLADDHTYQFYEPVINCSVTHLLYSSTRVSLGYFNDHSYLDLLGRQNDESLVTYR